jgi:putative tryptophan/tyrosine transport system substrate-binding protein
LGWTAGHNVRIDYHWGAVDADRSRRYAAESVALAPDVILASGVPVVTALLQATRTVPIVFAQIIDPTTPIATRKAPNPIDKHVGSRMRMRR